MRLTVALTAVFVCFAAVSRAEDQELTALVKQLDSGSLPEKTKAARMLGDIGPGAKAAAPSLVKALSVDNLGLRYEAVISLGRINADAKEAVPALNKLLADPLPLLRQSVIDSLRRFGPDAKEAIPQLKQLLADKEPLVSVSAARAIVEIELSKGPDIEQAKTVLISGLKNDSPGVVIEAIHGLADIGAGCVSAVQDVIGSTNPQACVHACDALAAIGAGAAPAVEKLLVAAKSSETALRWHAISALGDIGPAAKSAVPDLVSALGDTDSQVRFSAERSLHKIGKAAIPGLIEGLKREEIQDAVITVITDIGPDAKDAVPELAKILKSNNAEKRREAILALAAIGPDAKSTAPELIKDLGDKDFPNRPAAAFALGKMGAKEAIPVLKQTLTATDSPVLRLASVWALLQFDPNNEEYAKIGVPQLVGALEHEKPEIRREAARTLGRLKVQAKTAVAALQKLLKDTNADVRREALVALAEIGADSQPAVADIQQVMSEGDPATRPIACYALGKIGSGAKPAVQHLKRLLNSRDTHEKTIAAWALVNIAPDAETIDAAIPLLAGALSQSENPEVRAEAAKTLGKIGGKSQVAKDALKAAAKDSDESVRKAVEAAQGQLK